MAGAHGILLGASLIRHYPRVGLSFFGFLLSMLISMWVWFWGGQNDTYTYLTLIISFIIYMILMYTFVFPKIKPKNKKIIKCKHCGAEFDASESLICPGCLMTNAY